MKKLPPLGLIVEGKLTNSAILRAPALLAQLGPVKAQTARLAKRVTNFLGAGFPVQSFDEMEATRLVLIHVPDSAVDNTVREVSDAPFAFPRMAFVLCETWTASGALDPLAKLGAGTASCMSVPTSRGKWFILEGALRATRPLRRLLDRNGTRAFEIREGRKELLFAAEVLAGILPQILFERAQHALRNTALSGRQLRTLLDGMMQRTLLDTGHLRGSAPASALRLCSEEVAADHLLALSATEPELFGFLKQQIALMELADILRPSAKLKKDEQAVPLEVKGA